MTREQMRQRWLDKKAGKVEPEADQVKRVEDALRDMSPIQERASQEADRRQVATSSRYWFAVHFETEDQKIEFMAKLGIAHLSDGQYVDGLEAAEALDIEMTSPSPEFRKSRGNKRLADLA